MAARLLYVKTVDEAQQKSGHRAAPKQILNIIEEAKLLHNFADRQSYAKLKERIPTKLNTSMI